MIIGRGGTIDGRLDKGPPIPAAEFSNLQRKEENALTEAAAHLRETEEVEDAYDPEDLQREERRGVGWNPEVPDRPSPRVYFDPVEEAATPPRTKNSSPSRYSTSTAPLSPALVKRRVPTVDSRPWFGLLTLSGQRAICHSTEDMIDLQEEGAEFECTFPSKQLAEEWLDAPPPAPEPRRTLWYGLTEVDGAKVVCSAQGDLDFFLKAGANLKKTFLKETAADQWLNEQGPLPPARTTIKRAGNRPMDPRKIPGTGSHRHVSGVPRPSSSQTTQVAAMGNDDRPSHRVSPPRPRSGLASAMGSDPSTGDKKKIYDLVMADTEAMDEALCPPGLAYDDRECLFEQMIDVGALPGTYRRGDSEGDSGVSADMQMFATVAMRSLGGRGGRGSGNAANLTWASVSKNALDKIKGLEDVEKMISKIAGIRERLFVGQDQRVARFLHRRRYLQEDIDAYLENGLLPLIVLRTFRAYGELLAMARLEAYQCTSGWNGSLAKAMISYHSEKLGDIRAYAADWRDCLLETYVHLRDAEKNKFFSESMTRTLWRQGLGPSPRADHSVDEEEGNPRGGPTGSWEAEGRCSHCRRRATHEGTTKAMCPLKGLTATGARALLKSFSDEKAKQVTAAALAALAKDKDADPKVIIQTVRAAHGQTG